MQHLPQSSIMCLAQKILLIYGWIVSRSFTTWLMVRPPRLYCVTLPSMQISSFKLEQMHISPQTVQEAIRKLKHGKSDGGTLVSDHIIEAPTAIGHLLARLFTAILRHDYMPSSIRDAIIQPIPKGSKDPFSSANYWGIAVVSSLSKVLECLFYFPGSNTLLQMTCSLDLRVVSLLHYVLAF